MIKKFGVSGASISAGYIMIVIFFGATAIFTHLAYDAVRRLKGQSSLYRTLAFTSIVLLVSGALMWLGLLLSPLVYVEYR